MGKRKHLGGGHSKAGRDQVKCQIYRSQHRREKNKIRKLSKYMRKNPNDLQSLKVLHKYEQIILGS
jgi:hypothetical protein